MKKDLRGYLENGQFNEIADRAARRKRTLGVLVSLTYEADPLVAWRAVEAIGVAAERVADSNPDFVRGHLRRLHWLLSEESGGICLMAPPAMAEIVRRKPALFSDYGPITVHLLADMAEEDLGHFRNGILWAIGRLASVARDEIDEVITLVAASLDNRDAQVRGMTVWCLNQLGRRDLFANRSDLLSDDGPVEVYQDGRLEHTTVSALAHP
jgi:hypothetical protein